MFRIGHLGYFNDLMLCGTLCGVEMGLALARRSASQGRRQAAMDYLAQTRAGAPSAKSARSAQPPSAADAHDIERRSDKTIT